MLSQPHTVWGSTPGFGILPPHQQQQQQQGLVSIGVDTRTAWLHPMPSAALGNLDSARSQYSNGNVPNTLSSMTTNTSFLIPPAGAAHAPPSPQQQLNAYLPSSLLSPPSSSSYHQVSGGQMHHFFSLPPPASAPQGLMTGINNSIQGLDSNKSPLVKGMSSLVGTHTEHNEVSAVKQNTNTVGAALTNEEVLRIFNDLDSISRQRIMIEEQLRQVNLQEQTILLELLKVRPDALTPELIHHHLDILATHEMGSERLLSVVEHLNHSSGSSHRSAKGLDVMLTEVCQQAGNFASDRNGARTLIALLPTCHDTHLERLMKSLQSHIFHLSCDNIGHTVVNALIDHVAPDVRAPFRQAITLSLRAHVRELVVDMNGSSVIRTCLERWAVKDTHFILVALIAHCRELSCTRFGSEVLQRTVVLCSDAQRHIFANEVLSSFKELICDPCGNYVVQHFLDMNLPSFSAECARLLQGQVGMYATHKFASNVVERCIRAAPPDLFQSMYEELLEPNALPRLLKDKYGNYVVQTAVATATPAQRETAKIHLVPILHLVHHTACGRKLIQRLGAPGPLQMWTVARPHRSYKSKCSTDTQQEVAGKDEARPEQPDKETSDVDVLNSSTRDSMSTPVNGDLEMGMNETREEDMGREDAAALMPKEE